MNILYREYVTNEIVLECVDQRRKLLALVKSLKLKYIGHTVKLCYTGLLRKIYLTI